PGPLARLARLLDYVLPTARTVLPQRHESGLVNIPDSLLLLGRNGLRRLVTPGIMKRKIKRGIDQACDRGEIFHLWFHPSNFSYDTDTQLAILEDVLRYVAERRREGKLQVATMEMISKNIV
ncbi:polysaccharide deacetylase, partial [Candidatus Kaiserbacteria bacterium]|nr:polysaccharide deacetylase [Candidatus Kaiserbacteria bacterium]